VANDQVARECAQRRLCKDVTHEAVIFDDGYLLIVERGHPGRLLTAVLERVERVITKVRNRAVRGHNADDATGFFHWSS
jgi:hypothetical protein